MMRNWYVLLIASVSFFSPVAADEYPAINPTAVIINEDDEEEEVESYSGSAPLSVSFYANAENTEDWSEHYEWRFMSEDSTTPFLIRYEEDTEYTFTSSGSYTIELYAKFEQDDLTVEYTEEYWAEVSPITISISESLLYFPNAFSPNGDGINDIYKAKDGYQSIVEFKATIYNRWGQVLYSWTDLEDGWDGTYNGRDVAQGVYFVHVTAKGADGRKYNIKRDVNLIRGYTESTSN